MGEKAGDRREAIGAAYALARNAPAALRWDSGTRCSGSCKLGLLRIRCWMLQLLRRELTAISELLPGSYPIPIGEPGFGFAHVPLLVPRLFYCSPQRLLRGRHFFRDHDIARYICWRLDYGSHVLSALTHAWGKEGAHRLILATPRTSSRPPANYSLKQRWTSVQLATLAESV